MEFDTGYATFEEKLMVVCDARGEMHWLDAIEMRIESVDGRSCREVLDACALPPDTRKP